MSLRHPLGGPRRAPRAPIEVAEYVGLALVGVVLLVVRNIPPSPWRGPHA